MLILCKTARGGGEEKSLPFAKLLKAGVPTEGPQFLELVVMLQVPLHLRFWQRKEEKQLAGVLVYHFEPWGMLAL